jgi:2-keto-4-pentenoate hydratase/2-oxohepta-3-ene-1,7-dioic acid hydratase in catechol pathway
MKLCRFDGNRFGLIRSGQVFEVSHVIRELGLFSYPLPMGDPLVAALPELRVTLESVADQAAGFPLESVRLDCPIANPSKIVCAPVNYADHLAEGMADRAIHFDRHVAKIREVALFLKANSALAGPGDGVCLRNMDKRNDHELELALVIGRAADRVAREDAFDYIAGYMIGLDITTRGPEDRSFRKSSDTYALLGPWLVTADEIDNPEQLVMELSVNGQVRQQANTKDLIVKIGELIEWASACYTLHPGDILFTGTPAGVGPITPGDVIDAAIERIGAMKVDVRAA